ncbi:MAG TPA: 3-deoxy-7-phosphoheptulonate synthase [Thermoanaerobacter sp.]|nr:3-deoxy-7-phosphoheptulonate synthase [Thermoanaerobacter sp.]
MKVMKMNLKIIGDKNNKISIKIGNITMGKDKLIIAGPCAVENEEMLVKTAEIVKSWGANALRGGAYKPRTSPYSFQGLGIDGLKMLRNVGDMFNLPVVTEVLDVRDVEVVERYADVFQIGSRNMQNFSLLKEVGKTKKPVLLKRGFSATYEEWLYAAEYIAIEGNTNIIMCERGIRTFETYTRNTLDIAAIPVIHELSNLPIIADVSHGTGKRSLIIPMAKAAIAAGADGIMVEIHPEPDKALSDGEQSLDFSQFEELMREIKSY